MSRVISGPIKDGDSVLFNFRDGQVNYRAFVDEEFAGYPTPESESPCGDDPLR